MIDYHPAYAAYSQIDVLQVFAVDVTFALVVSEVTRIHQILHAQEAAVLVEVCK